jgi:DNA relaxase NicK
MVAAFLRDRHDHRPSRIDVARDIRAPGLFRRLLRLAKRTARKYGLRFEVVGDLNNADAGLTVYLGARQSQVFVRIYEKGLKYAHELGVPITDELREWVRVEVEFKPQNRRSKIIARTIQPDAIWGTAEWLHHFAQEAFSMTSERVNINQRRESNRDRALRWVGQQYRAHLQSLLDECDGDPARFGAALMIIAKLEGAEAAEAA